MPQVPISNCLYTCLCVVRLRTTRLFAVCYSSRGDDRVSDAKLDMETFPSYLSSTTSSCTSHTFFLCRANAAGVSNDISQSLQDQIDIGMVTDCDEGHKKETHRQLNSMSVSAQVVAQK